MKKYKVKDLNVHTYGSGRNKKFIIYTDYEYSDTTGPIWHTKVFPDIEGNKAKAIKESLYLLNSDTIFKPFFVKTGDFKVQISYR